MDTQENILRILITARDDQAMLALLRRLRLDLSCGGPKRHEGGGLSVEAYIPSGQLDEIKKYGVKVDVLDDASATARARQQEVGKGNRYSERQNRVPRGLGRKTKEDDYVIS
jgi:hypothetical protein